METLAFIHAAVAYEDPGPDAELRSFENINLTTPGSIALGVLSAGVFAATLNYADQAQANLGYGDRGYNVRQLQAQLGGIAVDGDFGPETLARLKEHQRSRNLQVDGVAGPATLPTLGLPPYLGSSRYIARRPFNRERLTFFRPYVKTNSGIGLNVREGPGTDYQVRYVLNDYDNVRIVDTAGGWAQLEGGGWVSRDFLRP